MADQAVGKLSPYLRRRRIAAAVPHLSGRVLDYGCGIGALADIIPPGRYTGVDADGESLDMAKRLHPAHRFYRPDTAAVKDGAFDSIALLAVLEHINDRIEFLRGLGALLAEKGKIVLTTPGPLAGPVHAAGSRMGLFSREAAEEHGTLVGFSEMERLARAAGFRITLKKRFLLGMNQLFVLEKA
ncbi:MAG TPA: class I SAM-dependent methyltransferase [Spirochaetota bacterium]|nr:class I SAM-dependent methyltransferase [Spirochaetota bacterium]